MTPPPQKTLLIGLDAACWEYLDPLLQQGKLPTIQKLRGNGAWGVLRSTLPATTPVAWSSIITGKNPGKHGVFDMLWKKPGSYDFFPTSSAIRQGTPFWLRLNEHGVRVGLVNVPFTFPPPQIEGFALAGFGSPDSASDLAYPPELNDWLKTRFPKYAPPAKLHKLRQQMTVPEMLADEIQQQILLVEITIQLLKEKPVDVLVINLMLLDHTNHLAQDMEAVNRAIIQMDDHLASLIDSFQPDNVLAISDHGSRRVAGRFLMHNWLLRSGLTARQARSKKNRKKALNALLAKQAHMKSSVIEKIFRRLLVESLHLLPGWTTRFWWTSIERVFPNAHDFMAFSGKTDYDRSKAYIGTTYSGALYINQAGRDPKGRIGPEEKRRVLSEMKLALSDLKDPDGALLFDGVYSPEELYQGPALQYAPDLVLDNYRSSWNTKLGYPGLIRGSSYLFETTEHEDGWHSRDGIFIYQGTPFVKAHSQMPGHVMDIPATLLHLHGIPVPEDFDGQVMCESLQPAWLAAHPVQTQPGDALSSLRFEHDFEAEDNEILLDQLRSLGYLD